MNDPEIWKPVVNYDGFYEVSSRGSVRSLGGRRGSSKRILKQADVKGYLCLALSVNGVRRTRLAHRLVAEVFLDNPLGLTEVNHKDGNKRNNCVENLEWTTHADNIAHAVRTKLTDNTGQNHGMHKFSEQAAVFIRTTKIAPRILAKKYGISDRTVSDIRRGKSWKHLALNSESGELS